MSAEPRPRFLQLLQEAAAHDPAFKLVLAHYLGGAADIDAIGADPLRLIARPVQLRGQPHLSVVLRYPTRDITQNWPMAEALTKVEAWLADGRFRNAHLHRGVHEWQCAILGVQRGDLRRA
jgi:hypothetical protein